MVEEDVDMLRQAIPSISMLSPQYMGWITLAHERASTNTAIEGVNPAFEEMRTMYPMAGGRFLSDVDVASQRRVMVIGSEIAKTLYDKQDPVGQMILLEGVPFTVVGVLQSKLQTAMQNGPDTRRAIIPYSTYRTMFGPEHINSIVVRPSDPEHQEELKKEIFRVLARKYHFDPADERTLFIWDFIEAEKIGRKIGLGVEIFLFSVGFLTLLIAGVGVANVMYVVVKERTREIGIKMALGARKQYILAQFIFEAVLIAFLGGTIGMLFSWSVVAIVHLFPSEEGVMQFLGKPILSGMTMTMTALILGTIGLLAGFFPARRAASVDPVESLRYE